jgi:hypothetical protein
MQAWTSELHARPQGKAASVDFACPLPPSLTPPPYSSPTPRHTHAVPCCDSHAHQRTSARLLQALLDGIAVCQPQPKIPPELIRYLGRSYNAWQIAIPLLESHCVMFPQAGGDSWAGFRRSCQLCCPFKLGACSSCLPLND